MTAKDLIVDFINFVFGIIIIGLTILYFIAGDNFENFKRILESLAPFGGLGVLFLFNFRIWREKSKKKEREGNLDLTLNLTFIDKIKSDIFLFLLPASVLIIAFLVNGKVGVTEILEASAVFAVAYFWQKWLFGKEKI